MQIAQTTHNYGGFPMLRRYIAFATDKSVNSAIEGRNLLPGGWDNVVGRIRPYSGDDLVAFERCIRSIFSISRPYRVQIVDIHEGKLVKEFTT